MDTTRSYTLLKIKIYTARPFRTDLNIAIQMWLTVGKADRDKIQDLLQNISPVIDSNKASAFNVYYPKGNFEADGRLPLDFNGGYHTLACLYAAAGDMEHVFWSFQKILDNNQHDYFELPRTSKQSPECARIPVPIWSPGPGSGIFAMAYNTYSG